MTTERFEAACAKTLALLKQEARIRGSSEAGMAPERCEKDPTAWRHMHWMLIQAALFYSEGKPQKANRWLGFVQGVLAMCGVDLDELKLANMPEGEQFDGSRV